MKRSIVILFIVWLAGVLNLRAEGLASDQPLSDADPHHLWNRLNVTLFQRTAADGKRYGLNELDILYWPHTTNVLAGEPHLRALAVLDEFIQSHGEKLAQSPLHRAWLQRDLYQLFSWTVTPWPGANFPTERRELQTRLATVIRRLALTTNEIAALPDNYALTPASQAPDLPVGLFDANSDWVNLRQSGGQEIAPFHDHGFIGSAFLIFFRVPHNRPAALAYLNQLHSFEHFWVYSDLPQTSESNHGPREFLVRNSGLPQFPTNAEWALVRKLLLIDTSGNLYPSPITESIQLRRYLNFSMVPGSVMESNATGSAATRPIPPQLFFEFQMDRRQTGGLHELGAADRDFLKFMRIGSDPFEHEPSDSVNRDSARFKEVALNSCRDCHMAPGIYSVNCYAGIFGPRTLEPPELLPSQPNTTLSAALDWKRGTFGLGLLQGLWAQH